MGAPLTKYIPMSFTGIAIIIIIILIIVKHISSLYPSLSPTDLRYPRE